MPFHLPYDGPAPIAYYFMTYPVSSDGCLPDSAPLNANGKAHASTSTPSTSTSTSNKCFTSAFRGRALHGTTLSLPTGYTGLSSRVPLTASFSQFAQASSSEPHPRKRPRTNDVFPSVSGSTPASGSDSALPNDEEPTLRRSPRKKAPPPPPKPAVMARFSMDDDDDDDDNEDEPLMDKTFRAGPLPPPSSPPRPRPARYRPSYAAPGVSSSSELDPIPTSNYLSNPSDAGAPASASPPPNPDPDPEEARSEETHTQTIIPQARWTDLILWAPDGPADMGEDVYARTLGEWVGVLSSEVSFHFLWGLVVWRAFGWELWEHACDGFLRAWREGCQTVSCKL